MKRNTFCTFVSNLIVFYSARIAAKARLIYYIDHDCSPIKMSFFNVFTPLTVANAIPYNYITLLQYIIKHADSVPMIQRTVEIFVDCQRIFDSSLCPVLWFIIYSAAGRGNFHRHRSAAVVLCTFAKLMLVYKLRFRIPGTRHCSIVLYYQFFDHY